MTDTNPPVPKPTAVILDVDGTLCDNHGHCIVLPDYPKFYELSADSAPHPFALEYALAAYLAGHKLIVMTGRSEVARDSTVAWLDRHLLTGYDELIMRPQNMHRTPAPIYKRKALEVIRGFFTVVGAIDDDPAVIAMYTEHNIPVTPMPVLLGATS